MKKFDIIILGGGAAGLMCAAFTPAHLKTLIIEASPNLGKKVRISGGGKCNITNRFISSKFYRSDAKFIAPSLEGFTCKDSLEFFSGIDLEERDNGKLFGIKSAQAFVDRLIQGAKNAKIILNTPINSLTCKDKEVLESLHNYTFAPAGTLGFAKSEAAKGGVNTDEVNARTLESKLQKNLYFIGEVLDVTGCLGGYNLHWAFASAKQCGVNLT